jgi:cation diffusion facilitator CzcD-associated flavoprotein CzcO
MQACNLYKRLRGPSNEQWCGRLLKSRCLQVVAGLRGASGLLCDDQRLDRGPVIRDRTDVNDADPKTPIATVSRAPYRHAHIIMIGAGLAGVAAAVRLSQNGWHDFLILERGYDVGGTWRDNTYPGAACDIPSHLYAYSFAPNPTWTRSFSSQWEIQRYITDVTRRYGVRGRHVFGCEVTAARWNEAAARWELATSKGAYTAEVLIGAWGALCEPALPDVPGLENFGGHVFHSARWDHDADLTGKKIAVIGTGASAVQIVPAIAEKAASLHVYQRTAPWVLPRLERRYSTLERLVFRRLSLYQRLVRSTLYWGHEAQAIGLTSRPWLLKPVELLCRAKLRGEVRDPIVRRQLRPDYRFGCKRILISNSYYPAFNRENVHLVTAGIDKIVADEIRTLDGVVHETDAIVLATGFHVTDSPTYRRIFGRDGRSLAEVFDEVGRKCYKGSAIAGFPNLFILVGPNTGLGHNSMILMIESQVNYVVNAIEAMKRRPLRSLEVRQDAQDRYSRLLQQRLSRSVWNTGGCSSWYIDKHGANTTMWPGSSYAFRRITRKFDIEAYLTSTPEASEEKQSARFRRQGGRHHWRGFWNRPVARGHPRGAGRRPGNI